MSERNGESNRVFAYVRVRGLEASVEERERGGSGRCVVLCDQSGQRVASVSPSAGQRGVRPGVSLWEAQRRCPELLVVEPNPEKYEHFWRQIVDICGDYTPEVKVERRREVSLDLTGTDRLFGPAKSVAQEIRNRLRVEVGVEASVGLGPNRTVARLACDSAEPGEVVEAPSEETAEFVGEMPIVSLPGVDEQWAERLGEMGIRQAKDLAALPLASVERAMGEWGRTLWEIARGSDPEHRQAQDFEAVSGSEESVSARVDLRPPAEERERLRAALRAAAEEVSRKLRGQGQMAQQVRVGLVFRDLRQTGARRTLRQPTRSSEIIFQAAWRLLDRAKLNGRPVRQVRVTTARLAAGPNGGQIGLPLPDLEREARRERLSEQVDRAKDRFGEAAVARANVRDLIAR